MIYLNNAANLILLQALTALGDQEFGYRFQHLVAAALRTRPSLEDLYENCGAGQPDCYSNASSHGFEIKCRSSSAPMTLDANSWKALPSYQRPRLVALLTVAPPYPLWVADLGGLAPGPIALSRSTAVDGELEIHLQRALSQEVEAAGANRICEGTRERLQAMLSRRL